MGTHTLCVQAVSYTLTPMQTPPELSLLTLSRTRTNTAEKAEGRC